MMEVCGLCHTEGSVEAIKILGAQIHEGVKAELALTDRKPRVKTKSSIATAFKAMWDGITGLEAGWQRGGWAEFHTELPVKNIHSEFHFLNHK